MKPLEKQHRPLRPRCERLVAQTGSLPYRQALHLVAQVSNLLYRRLLAGRALASLARSEVRQPRGLEIRDTADWKSALRLPAPSAAPTPLFRTGAKTGRNRIVPYIPRNPSALVVVPNPVVKRLRLPKAAFLQSEQAFGAQGSKLFPALDDSAQQLIWHWPDQHVNMVGHHHPLVKLIPTAVEKAQRIRHHLRNLRPAQMASTLASVQIALDFSKQLAIGGFPSKVIICRELANRRGALPLESQQHFAWQRIGQTKRHEVACTFAFDVRQIAPRVNPAAQTMGSFGRQATGAQLVVHAPQAQVGFTVGHGKSLIRASGTASPLFVAQVSNLLYRRLPAGGASAGLARSVARPLRGLEIRDTADWKSALQATGAAIPALVAQVSNLPYRRLPAGRASASLPHSDVRQLRGLEIRDTADWKSALRAAKRACTTTH